MESTRTQDRRRLLESFTGVPATEGNRVDVLRNGEQIFPAMLEAIEAAEHRIDFMTFVYWRGEITRRFAEAFAERARAGVRVRVLLDGFGAHAMDPRQRHQMRRAGVQVVEFRPFPSWRLWQLNLRTHRRVLVCDGTVGFTGGVGIAQAWADGGHDGDTPAWRETHFRVTGPAVAGIHAAFLSNWMEKDHRTLDEHDHFPPHATTGHSAVQVIRGSSQLGWTDMAIAMRDVQQRGDQRQVGLLVHDPDVTAVLDQHFEDDLDASRPVTPAEWARRPLSRRVMQLASHALTYPVRGAGAVR